MAKHTCKNCGKVFESNLHTVYCDECRHIVKKEVTCKECGNIFYVGIGKNGQFLQQTICDDCNRNRPKKIKCDVCGEFFELRKQPPDYRHYPKRTTCFNCKPAYKPTKYKIMICATCGKEFTIPESKNYINCEDCRGKLPEYKTLICQRCGKEFKVGRANNERNNFLIRKYCSKECEKVSEKSVVCENCGKEFTVHKYDGTDSFQKVKYCSDACRKEAFNENRIKTCIDKYGVSYYTQTPEYKDKVKDTCIEKYGVPYPCMTDNCKESQGSIISCINKNLADLLDSLGIDYKMEFILGTYSYDFHILNTNILLEINPTFTHTCYNTGVYPAKSKNSHIDKTIFAENNGYRCINVWQWDDFDMVVNMVKYKQKLYARKLKIIEIDKQEADEFLNTHHLQGSCYGNIVNFGLFDNDNLIQIMTFGKPRYNKNYQWELLRLCSDSNYFVVGGAERLFKHFIDVVKPKSIISYCDVSKFNGGVYERLGFKLLRQTQPAKIWSKYKNYNKAYITDNLLRQRGFDQLFNTNYGKGTSNEQLMLEYDWLPVYDCGQKVFVWVKNDDVV